MTAIKQKREFPEVGYFVLPFVLGLAVSPFFGASSSRGAPSVRNCSWREELVVDSLSGAEATLPVLECDSPETAGAKERYGVSTPVFHFVGGRHCSFVPAEFVFPKSGGTPEVRVLPEARDARLYHMKQDLERLSRGEEPVCLPASSVKVVHVSPAIAPSASEPLSPTHASPPPAPSLRPMAKALASAVESLPKNARICVVTDRSGSMQPHLQAARELLLKAAQPSEFVEWGTVDASTPEYQALIARPAEWATLLESLGSNVGPANSHERIIESVATCRDWVAAESGPDGVGRKIWVLSDEQNAPRSDASLLGGVRARLRSEGIELQFMDPNHQRCPRIARDGLKDSTRAAWIARMQVSGSGGFDSRCGVEVARAAIWGWLGPDAWAEVRAQLSGSGPALAVDVSGVILLSALLDTDSGLTRAEADRWYREFISDLAALERGSEAAFPDMIQSGFDGTTGALADLRSQVTKAYRRRYP